MFSPAFKRFDLRYREDRNHGLPVRHSPVTPFAEITASYDNSIHSRPETGTPAPWIHRFSLIPTTQAAKKSEEKSDAGFIELDNIGPAHGDNTVSKRAVSEAWNTIYREREGCTGIVQQTAQDKELESLLGHLFHHFISSGQVNGSLEKLRDAKAFENDGERNVFARASKSIVDTFAKHWTTTRGSEILVTTVVATQLMDKQQKHEKFLQFLASSKCHEELCDRARSSLQIIMEHGEKLAGMIQLRELQNIVNQSHSSVTYSSYLCSDTKTSGSLWDLIQLVGDKCRQNSVLLMDRDNAEIFYSKVSDLEEFFYCLEKHLEYIISTDKPILVQIHRASELANACEALVHTALQYKNEHQIWYPSFEGLTPWYCHLVVRNGLWSVASSILELLNERNGLGVSVRSEIYSQFVMLVEVLLEAYTGIIPSKVGCEEEKSLLEEFTNRRDALLECLYQQITYFTKNGREGLYRDNDDQIKELSSDLMSIAKRHRGYQTLWRICCDIGDLELLRKLMKESMGPNGGFSHYVLRQLFETRQFPKLLRLGEEFHVELSTFLKMQPEPDLMWLHQVFLHQFPSASETLHMLALSQNDISNWASLNQEDPESYKLEPTLSERRHFLNLSKVAALAAGKDAQQEMKIKRIEADLKILKLQESIMGRMGDEERKQNMGGKQLLPPTELIRLCLSSADPEIVLCAFDVFAWTSSSFVQHNKGVLVECWRRCADDTDWRRVHDIWANGAWNDEECMKVLSRTMLFRASKRCYEAEPDVFEQVLPLQTNGSGDDPQDSGSSSVEGILRDHQDFQVAGKLMLTAIILGASPAHMDAPFFSQF